MIIDPSSATVHIEPETDNTAKAALEKPWRQFLGSEWVIVYVTVAYSLITLLMWRTIKRQADIMDRQAREAKESSAQTFEVLKEQTDNALISAKAATISAIAADESAKASLAQIRMMKEKERGRLRLDFEDLDLTRTPLINTVIVSFKICLDGSTQAYVLDSECFAGVFARDEIPGQRVWSPPMTIPPVVTPAMGQVNSFTLVHKGINVLATGLGEPTIRSIQDSASRICCEGYIRYRDVFGETWRFNFKKRWEYFSEPLPENEAWQGGQWKNYGEPEDNGEYEVSPTS